jgi:hypothetical protein
MNVKVEDKKGVIRSRKKKTNREYNGLKKNDERTNMIYKTLHKD